MTQMLFGSIHGFPGFVGFPQTPEEDAQLDSTTVDELDLILSTEELLAKASCQSKLRGFKMKRLREKLWAERARVKEAQSAAIRFKSMNDEAETALSALRTEYDRADEAARSLGFELAKATTRIRNLRSALRRIRKTPKTPAQEASLPECIICCERPRTIALVPCGHTVLCEACSHRLADHYVELGQDFRCPICKDACQYAQKLFL